MKCQPSVLHGTFTAQESAWLKAGLLDLDSRQQSILRQTGNTLLNPTRMMASEYCKPDALPGVPGL